MRKIISVASRRLHDWLDASTLSGKQVGARLGVSESHISHLRAGNVRPSVRIAVLIERLTSDPALAPGWKRGPIRCAEWLDEITPKRAVPEAPEAA